MSRTATLPQWQDERFIELVVDEVFVFIKQTFLFPRLVATADLKEGKSCREKRPLPDPDLPKLLPLSFARSQAILDNDSVAFRLQLIEPPLAMRQDAY